MDHSTATDTLSSKPWLSPRDPAFKHGRLLSGTPTPAPTTLWSSTKPPRADHSCPAWLTASEFSDTPAALRTKIKLLASLIRASTKTVVYTGAGISASVVGQAALSGTNKTGWKATTTAQPTPTHHGLSRLCSEGLIHSWIQQNHDGLPQKAGVPQHIMNEIHGSWYDPSNPVVKYTGSLSERLEPGMRDDARTADLVLVLGTSLSGLNADQCASLPASRSLIPIGKQLVKVRHNGQRLVGYMTSELKGLFHSDPSYDDDDEEPWDGDFGTEITFNSPPSLTPIPSPSPSLGTVCINLQQTPLDGAMSLRVFGKSDDVLRLLLAELGLDPPRQQPTDFSPAPRRFLVPYDETGKRTEQGQPKMWMDLRDGTRIKLCPGHNIQEARQPAFMHIGSTKKGKRKNGRVNGVGNGTVKGRNTNTGAVELVIEGVLMKLGLWWIQGMQEGSVDYLPFVMKKVEYDDEDAGFTGQAT